MGLGSTFQNTITADPATRNLTRDEDNWFSQPTVDKEGNIYYQPYQAVDPVAEGGPDNGLQSFLDSITTGPQTTLPRLQMNTINEEVPSKWSTSMPQNTNETFQNPSINRHIMGGALNPMSPMQIYEMNQHLMFPHIHQGAPFQGRSGEPGAAGADERLLSPSQLQAFGEGMIMAQQQMGVGGPHRKDQHSSSPRRRRSTKKANARRQQELKSFLNQDLQIHQRNQKISSNDEVRAEMSPDRFPSTIAKHQKPIPYSQLVQQILNGKSQQSAAAQLAHNQQNERDAVKKMQTQMQEFASKIVSPTHSPQRVSVKATDARGNMKFLETNQLSTYSNMQSYQIKEDQNARFGSGFRASHYSGSVASTQARFFHQPKRRPTFDQDSLQSAFITGGPAPTAAREGRASRNGRIQSRASRGGRHATINSRQNKRFY